MREYRLDAAVVNWMCMDLGRRVHVKGSTVQLGFQVRGGGGACKGGRR